VTGLESVVAEALDGVALEAALIEEALEGVIESLETVAKAASKNPVKISVGHIVHWKAFNRQTTKRINDWWEMKRSLMLASKNEPLVHFIAMNHMGCRLEKDGVHLTEAGAKAYFKWVMEQSEKAFAGETIDVGGSTTTSVRDWNMDVDDRGNRPSRNDRKRGRSNSSVLSIDGDQRNPSEKRSRRDKYVLFSEYDWNRKNDQKTMARMAEDQDYLENKVNLNKIIIQGLTVDGLLDIEERKDRVPVMKHAVIKLLTAVAEATKETEVCEPETVFLVNEGAMKKNKNKKPMFEATFSNAKYPIQLRQVYGTLSKSWKENGKRSMDKIPMQFRGVYINPSHNHRTRVRISVLKAVSKAYNSYYPRNNSWVIDHVPRPVLKIIERDENARSGGKTERTRSLTYIEAVKLAQANNLVGRQDLLDSLKLAGSGYGRMLENFFILLK